MEGQEQPQKNLEMHWAIVSHVSAFWGTAFRDDKPEQTFIANEHNPIGYCEVLLNI